MAERLTGLTNSYHSYSLEEALAGIAEAGFKSVELTSVPGWTEHVRRDSRRRGDRLRQGPARQARSDRGQSSPATPISSATPASAEFRKALNIAKKLGIAYVTTSTGGHDASSSGSLEEQREALPQEHPPAGRRSRGDGHHDLPRNPRRSARDRRDFRQAVAGHRQAQRRHQLRPRQCHLLRRRPPGDRHRIAAAATSSTCTPRIRSAAPASGISPAAGTGEVDFKPIFAALDAVGFDGPVSVEIEFTGEPWPPLDEVDAQMKAAHDYLRPFVKE